MARRDYAGAAVPTVLQANISSSAVSIAIADATGWPDGSNGKFYVTIDRTGDNPEKILVLSRSGTTLTLTSAADRGVDGTTAATHDAGDTIEHTIASPDVDEPNAHINDTGLDHHTQYLNTTRHDVTARHTAGTVVPTAAAGTIEPDDVAAEGTASTLARSDHTHTIVAAAASASAVADVAAEGTATSFARSDHVHGREAFAAPGDSAVGDAATEGVATTVARSDHVHGREAFDDPVAVGLANDPGAADTISRSDHVHEGLAVGEFTDYTPTWGNLTVGNGTVVARYWQYDKKVTVHISLVWGSTTSVSSFVTVTMPIASVNQSGQEWVGTADYVDTGTTHYFGGLILGANTTTANLLSGDSATSQGLVTAASPFTAGNGDRWNMTIEYEVA